MNVCVLCGENFLCFSSLFLGKYFIDILEAQIVHLPRRIKDLMTSLVDANLVTITCKS